MGRIHPCPRPALGRQGEHQTLKGLQTPLPQQPTDEQTFGSRASHSNSQQFYGLALLSATKTCSCVCTGSLCCPPWDEQPMADVAEQDRHPLLVVGALPTLLWGLEAAAPSAQPGPSPAPRQSPAFWPPEQHQLTLCFSPGDQPELLMLCCFPSHALLTRHGKGPARFKSQEKPPGQGSPFSLVPHKVLCDQIRHGAMGVRNTWCTQTCLLFPEKGNRALPCSPKSPRDLTAGCLVLSVPSPLCYLITNIFS